jgi:hypothetical protein
MTSRELLPKTQNLFSRIWKKRNEMLELCTPNLMFPSRERVDTGRPEGDF